MIFELTQVRALLLVFPNTFEYFFIAYEACARAGTPLRLLMKGWVLVAAPIWIFIKLPQEYWIHVAQLDVTDTVRDYAGPAADRANPRCSRRVLVRGAAPRCRSRSGGCAWRPTRSRRRWTPAAEQAAWRADDRARVSPRATVEKVALVALLGDLRADPARGRTRATSSRDRRAYAFVVVNAALGLPPARRDVALEVARRPPSRSRYTVNARLVLAVDVAARSGLLQRQQRARSS